VYGPTQFSIYINDMVDEVGSDLIQFADDTKLWRIIRTQEDRDVLQKDLDILVNWSKKMDVEVQSKEM